MDFEINTSEAYLFFVTNFILRLYKESSQRGGISRGHSYLGISYDESQFEKFT